MTEVHILIDVDGVINALSTETSGWWNQESYIQDTSQGSFLIRYAPGLVEALNMLAALPDVKFYWLTTWLDLAPTELAPNIGLNGEDWPVLGAWEYGTRHETGLGGIVRSRRWWKLPAAQAHHSTMPADARMIWLDDDLNDEDALNWCASVDNIFPLRPDPRIGLTPQNIVAINDWI